MNKHSDSEDDDTDKHHTPPRKRQRGQWYMFSDMRPTLSKAGNGGRDSIFVSVSNVRAAQALNEDEIASRRFGVQTNGEFVIMEADEHVACLKLRTLQHAQLKGDPNAVVFQNIFGDRFKYTGAYVRGGTRISAFFSHWPSEADDTNESTPALSFDHEEAVAYAVKLATDNNLFVATVCDYKEHRPVPVSVGWVPTGWNCVKTIEVNGTGIGLSTTPGFRWCPDPADPTSYFVLDAAVLENGKLKIAIEIERSHANSQKKRTAFLKHSIDNVQIRASELNALCRTRPLDADTPVVVKNHPITAREIWICAPCETLAKIEDSRLEAIRRREEKERHARDAFEKDKLTTYDVLEAGKFLKGYVHIPSFTSSGMQREENDRDILDAVEFLMPAFGGGYFDKDIVDQACKRLNSPWRQFVLNETNYDAVNNPSPKRLKFFVHRSKLETLRPFWGRAVCLKLPSMKLDRQDPSTKIGFFGENAGIQIHGGAHLPGFKREFDAATAGAGSSSDTVAKQPKTASKEDQGDLSDSSEV